MPEFLDDINVQGAATISGSTEATSQILKLAAGQTQPFLEFEDADGNILAGVNIDGTPSGALATAGGLAVVATTGVNGYELVDDPNEPTILTWTAPNDGNLHFATVAGTIQITAALTGGQINLNASSPVTNANGMAIFTATAAGWHFIQTIPGEGLLPVPPNQSITVIQRTAMTAGAGTFYGAIFAL